MRYHRDLFVDPLFWTFRHLNLVGCHFTPLESREIPQDIEDAREAQNNDEPRDRVPPPPPSAPERLAKSCAPLVKLSALYHILEYEGSAFEERCSRGPKFYFAGKAIHRPKYVVFGRRKQANEPLDDTLIGYFDYTFATYGRKDKFQAKSHPGNGNNAPVGRLHTKQLARITPANWEEDPYFVCLLLAIAQLQQRSLPTQKQTTHTSRLLVAKWPDCEFIYLYEAQFTSELLKAIENPKAATTYTTWPTITRKIIPYKPYDTFRSRLVAELLLTKNQNCYATSGNKDCADFVVRCTTKRPHQQDDETRTVKRKVDMAYGK
ncbi:hypothetical protein P170DRAFT_425133 [Aspergillus steynii IBT 23096]|uniref:Uncharacterized protein n=1 Tax=Aspergillus steynii IBT 23096 TaxID=1392250 RepID=A0A2I2GD79_9EURO|nr:uncharacterized protein P170DRAFT_425133 [Aspergillus steynii IBT 23096]PLB50833.1 hypothetical protein P170DRAFT_425133 [Aspergillus steynii IBT 23096]